MKIKEAARVCGLTEKAIRFYEAKGLISPDIHVYEQNGRSFRDYDETTVQRLKTIAGLRRAFFSVEQISRMLDDPRAVAEVYPDYLAELHTQYAQLDVLIRRADAVPKEALVSAEALSAALDVGTLPDKETAASALPFSTVAPDFHFRVWDEEEGRDERDRLCEHYFGAHAGWGIRYDISLFVGRIVKFLLIGAAVFLVLMFVPYIEHVDVRYTGYELLFDPLTTDADGVPVITEAVPREISFSGEIYHYLLRDTVFKGSIGIEGYSYLKWQMAASIRGLDELSVPDEKEARRAFPMKKDLAGPLGSTEPPKIIWNGFQYQMASGTTSITYLIRDDRQVWADAVCTYRRGKLSPGAVFLLREFTDEYGWYRCGYSGVFVFPAETEEEAKTMFSDTVWTHWREEYGTVPAYLPY